MTIIEKNIIDKIKNYKTIFIYGGWGIGKTHFAKNVLYEEMAKLEKEKATLYIDARVFDQDKNMFDYVAFFARNHKSKKAKFRNFGINGSKVLLNSLIFASNNFFKTNIKYSKINKNNSNKEDVEVEIKEMHDDLVIIIDELDRLTPDTIIKTLNFINGLSIMNEKIQIILIGNKKELESILSLRFNISISKNSFLHKYFELEINMDSVVSDYAKEVFSNNDNWKDVFQEWELSGSPREIERSLLLYKNVKDKYKRYFFEDVFEQNNKLIFFKGLMRRVQYDFI